MKGEREKEKIKIMYLCVELREIGCCCLLAASFIGNLLYSLAISNKPRVNWMSECVLSEWRNGQTDGRRKQCVFGAESFVWLRQQVNEYVRRGERDGERKCKRRFYENIFLLNVH